MASSRVIRSPLGGALAAIAVAIGTAGFPSSVADAASGDYRIVPQSIGAGGGRVTSAAYRMDSDVGGVAGLSAGADATTRHGYAGQLYDMTGVELSIGVVPAAMDEGSSRQAQAAARLDDATKLAITASDVVWSVVSGPIASATPLGMLTAGAVYTSAVGVVRGSYRAAEGTLGILVLDVDPDNYGIYAGDQLPDGWQVDYFGTNNPRAGPTIDADGDGQANLFEYVAGLVPTSGVSRFDFHIHSVTNSPEHCLLVFSPRLDGRTYTLQSRTNLITGVWDAQVGVVTDDGAERSVADTNALDAVKFYRVRISMP